MPTARQLFRATGSPAWGMSLALAVALGAVFVVCDALGRSAAGAAIALGVVLTAVPGIPDSVDEAARVIGVRTVAIGLGTLTVLACDGHEVLLGVATVLAAMLGAVIPRLGPTAALTVVLVAMHMQRAGDPPAVLYLSGSAVVCVAAAVPLAISALRRSADVVPSSKSRPGPAWEHVAGMGAAVAVAAAAAALVPEDVVGAHWLITGVVLSIQADTAATGIRLAQRLSGNLVGAVLAAVILAATPAAPVVIAIVVVLFWLAMALRPVNYTWWAVTGPPVLLLTSEYPAIFPWYEGGVRLAMNIAGALIVVVVVFGIPRCRRLLRPAR
ncbi:FUSC family protein [Mycobacterium sp. NPDC003323]